MLVNSIVVSVELTRSTLSLEMSPALQVAYGVNVVVRREVNGRGRDRVCVCVCVCLCERKRVSEREIE